MPKTTRESYKMGLIATVSGVLFSTFFEWFIFVAFPDRPREISAPALYFVERPQAFGGPDLFFFLFFPFVILVAAWLVSRLIIWLGEEIHIGAGASWRFVLLGFLGSFSQFSDLVPNINFFVWLLVLLAYWLLFHKFGLNRELTAI